ncbi:MAG: 50S ribosomal protein L7/L12 [Candidatus Beckwithbacteria bacterium GW2011_GWA2_43_10]|uniref:Large ribosomal subunit protein bL12 n=1 Tax=Candidatus Beckwithbacteria bacterium GW2011_GWA2_43_10 TaxID=1618369 RepID=A0A0G1C0W6_9BACT|nr:MAG: 50S ribosomal protein L7/L12 [Candidatus Beckwithbacteria bacterium GW2011_GWA2_43_10]
MTDKLSPKLTKIIEEVEKLSVLELADLVKALEDKLGVSAAAPVAAVPVAAGASAPQAAEEAKSEYQVVLTSSGANKIGVIKALREIKQELGLKEAKDLAEAAPKEVGTFKKEEAETAKKKLEAAGAQVELK